MGKHSASRHPVAYYVTRRRPAKWLCDGDEIVIERFKFAVGGPRLLFRWGTFRAPRRGLIQRPPRPGKLGSQ